YDLARFATRLLEREDLGWADLVLAFASALIGVALIIGFASRLAHFKQEATLREIKIICLLACGHTDRLSHEPGGQSHNWHLRLLDARPRPHEDGLLLLAALQTERRCHVCVKLKS